MIIYRQIRLRIIQICVISNHDTTFRVIQFSVICIRDIIYWVIRFCAIRIVKKNIRIWIRSRIRDISLRGIRFCAIRIRGIVKKNIRILIRSRIRDISLRGIRGNVNSNFRIWIRSWIREISLRVIRFCAIRIVKKNIRIELSLICYRWIGLCLIGSSGIKNSCTTRFCKYLWCCYFIYSYLFHTI